MKTQEKGLLLLYLRQLFPLSHSKSFDAILSYKHDVTNLYLPCDFQEIIEIPIYENDSFCEFKFQIYLEEEDFSNNVKFTFEELNLSSDSIKTFSLELTFKAYKFFLIFDAYFKSSLTESKNNNNNVMMVKVHQLKDITMFLKKRQLVNREKQILRKNISDYKYFIELRYFEQKFALELSLEELNNLNLREFYFIYNIKELTHPFTVEVIFVKLIFYFEKNYIRLKFTLFFYLR